MHLISYDRYPNLSRFVRRDLPGIAANHRIFAALVRFGQFSNPEDAKQALSDTSQPWGIVPSPWVEVTKMRVGRYGHYQGGFIQINEVIAIQYERIAHSFEFSSWSDLLPRAKKMVEAIILHEMVHWHDLQADFQHTDRPEEFERQGMVFEQGDRFERAAYGRIMSRTDITGWMGWDKNGRPYNPADLCK